MKKGKHFVILWPYVHSKSPTTKLLSHFVDGKCEMRDFFPQWEPFYSSEIMEERTPSQNTLTDFKGFIGGRVSRLACYASLVLLSLLYHPIGFYCDETFDTVDRGHRKRRLHSCYSCSKSVGKGM